MTAKRQFLKVLFRAVDTFMTIGTRNAEFYRSYGISDANMVLTPYSVDNEAFFERRRADPDMRTRLRDRLGIRPGDPVVLFVGKLIDRKRPADLIDAFERVQSGAPAASLILVGEGDQRRELEEKVARKGLRNVHFVGFQNRAQIVEYFAAADVFVLPSTHETFGLVVNEAMCFGLPIVASHLVGSTADLVKQGINGFVFPATDVDQLAQHLKMIVGDAELRRRMGAESERMIRQWGYAQCVSGFRRALGSQVGAPAMTNVPVGGL